MASFEYKMDEAEPSEVYSYNLPKNDIVTLQVKRRAVLADYVRLIAPVINIPVTSFQIIDWL